jgi:hypothetical protein
MDTEPEPWHQHVVGCLHCAGMFVLAMGYLKGQVDALDLGGGACAQS